jgi:hypothetical protein
MTATDRAPAGQVCPAGYISPLIVSCLGTTWAAVCISPQCGLPHDVLGGNSSRTAAETAANNHLKTLHAKEAA